MSLLRKDSSCFTCSKFIQENKKRKLDVNEVRSLKKCVPCQTAVYCSTECQKLDWKEHKRACKRIKTLCREIQQIDFETMNSYKNLRKVLEIEATGKNVMVLRPDMLTSGLPIEPFKVTKEHRLLYLDRRIALAYAYWHEAEASNNYTIYEKFEETTFNILHDQITMQQFEGFNSFSNLVMFLMFSKIKRNEFQMAYYNLRYWMNVFIHSDSSLRLEMNQRRFDAMQREMSTKYPDVRENLIEVVKKFFVGCRNKNEWEKAWDVYYPVSIPALVVIKTNEIVRLQQRKEDAKNFAEVCNCSNGGMFAKWNSSYPMIIKSVKSYLLGYSTHRRFQSILR